MEHFQLHFEPQHRVLYQEPTGAWLTASWQDIATSPSIKRIQYNTEKLKNYIIVDIDNSNLYQYRDKLPEPNFIIKNKNKAGGHLFWVLDRTVSTPYYTRVWSEIFKSFTIQAGGDTVAKGFIAKNLNNNIDFDIEFIEPIAYDINSLKTYATPTTPETLKIVSRASKKPIHKQLIVTEGRNVELFDKVRVMAYKEINRSMNDNDFILIVSSYAQSHNQEYDYPLDERELKGIVKSIVNYCIRNRAIIKKYNRKRGTMNLDESLELKEKQKLSANYSSKLKATKNEMKIKVAIIEMKKQELKINISSVAKYTKIHRNTISKYKEFLT